MLLFMNMFEIMDKIFLLHQLLSLYYLTQFAPSYL